MLTPTILLIIELVEVVIAVIHVNAIYREVFNELWLLEFLVCSNNPDNPDDPDG